MHEAPAGKGGFSRSLSSRSPLDEFEERALHTTGDIMSDLISQRELADRLEVSEKRVEGARREEEWVRRQYPVADWAVFDEEGELLGYDVPEVPRRKLGMSGRSASQQIPWWKRIFGI